MLRAKQSYHDEREHMLLLLLDCFKLSLLDPATNPAQPAATAFIAKLEAGGGGAGATPAGALGGLGGAPAAAGGEAGGEALSMQLLRAVAAGATNPAGLPADPHRRKELTQACVCLLLLCHAQKRPPHAVAAGLCTLLRQVSAQLGACASRSVRRAAALLGRCIALRRGGGSGSSAAPPSLSSVELPSSAGGGTVAAAVRGRCGSASDGRPRAPAVRGRAVWARSRISDGGMSPSVDRVPPLRHGARALEPPPSCPSVRTCGPKPSMPAPVLVLAPFDLPLEGAAPLDGPAGSSPARPSSDHNCAAGRGRGAGRRYRSPR